jgi:hypothetical protein
MFIRLILAASVLGLAGCAATEATPSVTPGAGTAAAAASAAPATAGIDPCSLISVNDLSRYGTFTGPDAAEMGGARVCMYQRKLASASDIELGVSINVRDKQGLSLDNELGGGAKSGKVGGRDSVEARGESACVLELAVGDRARVDLSITGDTVDVSCAVAQRLATIVEPKLPRP